MTDDLAPVQTFIALGQEYRIRGRRVYFDDIRRRLPIMLAGLIAGAHAEKGLWALDQTPVYARLDYHRAEVARLKKAREECLDPWIDEIAEFFVVEPGQWSPDSRGRPPEQAVYTHIVDSRDMLGRWRGNLEVLIPALVEIVQILFVSTKNQGPVM